MSARAKSTKSGGRGSRARADAWSLDLRLERNALFFYRYRWLHIECVGRRASVRELSFELDYDFELELVTKPRKILRQRGRSLPPAEAAALRARIEELDPARLAGTYPCLDDMDPAQLDPCVGPDGVPIAVSTGEEGPACLTLRTGRDAGQRVKRVVIERYRPPAAEAAQVARAKRAPLAAFLWLVDEGLKVTQPFKYRRCQPSADLAAEFQRLRGLAFLNLRHFERRCLEALGWLGDPATLPCITSELFSSDSRVRLQALDALATIGDGAAAPEVELLTDDDQLEVRERAREVLGDLRLLRQ